MMLTQKMSLSSSTPSSPAVPVSPPSSDTAAIGRKFAGRSISDLPGLPKCPNMSQTSKMECANGPVNSILRSAGADTNTKRPSTPEDSKSKQNSKRSFAERKLDPGRNKSSVFNAYLDGLPVHRAEQSHEMDDTFPFEDSTKHQSTHTLLNEKLGLLRGSQSTLNGIDSTRTAESHSKFSSGVKAERVSCRSNENDEGFTLSPTSAFKKIESLNPSIKPLRRGSPPRLEPFLNPQTTRDPTMEFLPPEQKCNLSGEKSHKMNFQKFMLPPVMMDSDKSMSSSTSMRKDKPKKVGQMFESQSNIATLCGDSQKTYLELVLTICNEELEKWNRIIGESRKRLGV